MSFDAIILNGGAARRFGGLAKFEQTVGGRSLLTRVRSALIEADRVVLVGRSVGSVGFDAVLADDPPGGGPVPALAAGMRWLASAPYPSDIVVTVAADLPFVTADVVQSLVQAASAHDVAVLVDAEGRDQLLVAAWRRDVLAEKLTAEHCVQNARILALFSAVDVRRVRSDAHPPPWWDCDTPGDLEQAQRWAEEDSE